MPESLKFKLDVDNSELKKVSKALDSLGKDANSGIKKRIDTDTEMALRGQIEKIKKYNDLIDATKKNMATLKASGNEEGYDFDKNLLEDHLRRKAEEVKKYNELLDQAFKETNTGPTEIGPDATQHEEAAQAAEHHATALERLHAIMRAIGTAMGFDYVEQEAQSADEAATSTEKLSKASDKAAHSQSLLSRASEKLGGIFHSLAEGLGKLTSGFHLSHRAHGRSLTSMVKGVFIYQTVSRALRWLKEAIGNVITADSAMSGSLASIRGSLLMAFAPIANYVIPLLRELLSLLAAVASAFASFMGGLFGIAPAAQKNSAALMAQAGATKAAGGAAGGAAKTIAAFDEINQLNDSGGGGGGGGGGVGWSFDDIAETPIGEFAQKLRDAIARQDWIGLGTLLGEKVNEAINKIPWAKAGQAIGKGINALFGTAYGFLKTVDFYNLGAKIAEFFNNAIQTINWRLMGATIMRGILDLIDLVAGFIENLSWKDVVKAFKDFFGGAFDELRAWLGKDPGNINRMFTTDWIIVLAAFAKFGKKGGEIALAAEGVKNIALGLKDIEENGANLDNISTIVKGIGDDVTAFGLATGDIPMIVAGMILELAAVVIENWDWIKEHILYPIRDWALGIGDAITAWFEGIKIKLHNAFAEMVNSISDALDDFGIYVPKMEIWGTEAGNAYGEGFTEAVSQKGTTENVLALMSGDPDAFVAAGEAAGEAWGEGFVEPATGVSREQTLAMFADIEKEGEKSANKTKSAFSKAATDIKSKFATVKASVASAFAGLGNNAIAGLSGLVASYLSNINTAINGTISQLNVLNAMMNSGSSGASKGLEKFIPHAAQGAVIPANHRFLAVLGDQTSGTNIEAPLDTIVNAMQIALNNSGGGGGNMASALRQALTGMSIKVDGRTFGRIAADTINRNRQADGKLALNL